MATNRQNSYPTSGSGYKGQGMMGQHYTQATQGHGAANYLHRSHAMSPQASDNGMTGLANSMATLNVHGSYGNSMASKPGGAVMSGNASEYAAMPIAQGQGLWVPNMGTMYNVMAGGNQQPSNMNHSPGMYNHGGAFVPQAAYQYGQGVVDHSPMGAGWASRVSSGDMPALMTPRRDSISSNENDIPGTPYTSSGLYRYGTSTAIMDRSPGGIYTSSATPSPSQLAQYQLVNPKQAAVATISPQLHQLLQKDPPIPRAIPAPSSPLKPLDRSLENKTGETNVYIRGLLPETTDEMLYAWGKRFGDIQSSKSIIDLKTNLCKGFGFIKYHNFEDAESCIRGFHYLGYEVSFARESFYSKLKKFADESNTNLYVSNIPKNMNEHSRDICEEVIKSFNNTPVAKPGGDEHLIQIRYSDTHEQKMLKQQTAAGRIFRAAEYEVGVAQARGMTDSDRYMTMSPDSQGAANEFEMFLQQSSSNPAPYVPTSNRYRQPWTPAIPSSLGGSRPAMHQMVHAPVFKTEDGGSDRGIEIKTNPATPVKQEHSASPNRQGGDD
ncbi:hypothetical protein N0V90_003704 [Kalmusia sp. IMI 367209]|nr:hypothetical protein N0V90_003704 [Kalmusia sp. IMI 367209]